MSQKFCLRPITIYRRAVNLAITAAFLAMMMVAAPAWAAIAFDAASSTTGTSVSALTWSHTVGSAANRMLVVGVTWETSASSTVSSVTFGGVALTRVTNSRAEQGTAAYNGSELWYLAAPASGTKSVVVTYSGTMGSAIAGAISLAGAAQQTPEAVATALNANSTTLSGSITTLTDGAWVVDVINHGKDSSTLTANGTSQTKQWGANTSLHSVASGTRAVAAKGTVTNSWITTGSSSRTAMSMASFAAIESVGPQSPIVAITSPSNNSEVAVNSTIAATAADSDGTIASVAFYDGATLLGTDTSSPYSYAWSGAALGSHALTAVALDNSGRSTTSATVNVTVVANVAPTVAITNPANNASVSQNFSIEATAADSDGSVSSVAFYDGTTLLGTDTTSPYSFTWSGATAGSHALKAVAVDNGGRSTTSATVNVTVVVVDPNARYVVVISVDGMGSMYVTPLLTAGLTNELTTFKRFQSEGTGTLNARNDANYAITLPNHCTMMTGRGVSGATGHNWTSNTDPAVTDTLATNKGSYVASGFDVAHDYGLRTGIWSGKSKFNLFQQSFSATAGALDTTGADNGRDKIDYDKVVASISAAALTTDFVTQMGLNPFHFVFFHFQDPDAAGHASGWSTDPNSAYAASLKAVDTQIGNILQMISNSPTLRGKTTVILTADHGGHSTTHGDTTLISDYQIPFYVWGPNVPAGGDLYAMNPTSRTDPGTANPPYTGGQPVRNGDAANLALTLLGLPAVPGSTIDSAQDLVVGTQHFTVTADPRGNHTGYNSVLTGIKNNLSTLGSFHVDVGDYDDTPQENRAQIDAVFGANYLWYTPIGNHEAETTTDMDWVRAEYQTGNGVRTPLKNFTMQNGPAGSVETMYSVDYGNAHLVFINEYWNGGTAAGSDVARDGDAVLALRNWLDADLKATSKPIKLVFGHEPAYLPAGHNHAGDSLDLYTANRDAFWQILKNNNVMAMLNGHTHDYYKLLVDGVWQLDAGNAGNDNTGDGYTFIDVVLGAAGVKFDIWRDTAKTGTWVKSAESFEVPIPVATTVSITSPSNSATLTPNFTITASVGGTTPIASVAFYDGATLLGTDTTSPYSYTWNGAANGAHALKAVATDTGNVQTTSTVVNVTVSPTLNIAVGASGSGVMTFNTLPPASQWSTVSVSGGSGDVEADGTMDSAMSGIAAGTIGSALTDTASSTVAYRRSSDRVCTQPSGNKMTLLMASLQNTSGVTIDNLTVSFTLGLVSATPGELIKGYRMYWSKTGATGSWTAVNPDCVLATPGTTTPVSVELTTLGWANSGSLYFVWSDDNGAAGTDGDYTIDNVSFAPTPPKMLTFGLPDNAATISGTNIYLYVPGGTDVTGLAPAFTMSAGASCTVGGNPAVSGDTFNFTSPVHYVLQAGDFSNDYTVTVISSPAESTIVWNTGSGTWNHGTANWLGLASGLATPFYNGQNVIFNSSAGGTVTLEPNMEPASVTVSAADGTYTFSGSPVGGTGSLAKSGGGSLILSGTNDYTGATTVSGGTLKVNGSTSASSAVGVSGGVIGGTGTINGAVTLSGTGGIDLRDGAVGTLTLGSSLALTGGAGANTLWFDLGNNTAATDRIVVTGGVTAGSPVAIGLKQLGWPSNRVTAGTYDLLTAGSGTLPAVENFVLLINKTFGQTFTLALDGTSQKLQLTAAAAASGPAAAFWSGAANGSWSDAGNWNTDATSNVGAGAAPGYQSNVTFTTTTPGALNLTNTLDADFDINSLTFNGSTGGVTIGGSRTLTLEATNANGNTAGNGIIASAQTSGTNLISANIGLAASQNWNIGTGGTLTVSGNITDFGGNLTLTKAGSGTLNLNGVTTIGNLEIAHRSGVSANFGTVAIGSGGTLSVGYGSSSNVYIGVGTGIDNVGQQIGTLDASASAGVIANVNRFMVGGTIGGTGYLYLGANNTITAATEFGIEHGSWGFPNGYGTVTTAAGSTTTVHTPNMYVGHNTPNSTTGGSGTFTLGSSGASLALDGIGGGRAALYIGILASGNGGSSPNPNTMDLSGGTAGLKLSSLVLGQSQGGGNSVTGVLTLGSSATNHLDISSGGNVILMGDSAGTGTPGATGTLTIGNLDATSAVTSTDNSTAILLANKRSTGTPVATLNLNGGTLTITTTGSAIAGGGGTSTLVLGNAAGQGTGMTLKAGASSSTWIQNLTTAKIKTTGVTVNTNGYNITVPQALSADTTDVGGGLTKAGSGTLTLGGLNTYTGNTTVSAGTLVLADNAGLTFKVTDAASNKVTGAGTATLNGDFTIDTGAVTVTSGTWPLVDTTAKTFSSTFTVAGSGWAEAPAGLWSKTVGDNTWRFSETDGKLTLNILPGGYANWAGNFSPPLGDQAADADPDGDGLANALEYVFGTDPRYSNAGGPDADASGDNLVLTFSRDDDSEGPDLSLRVEVSNDLGDWTTHATYDIGADTAGSSEGVEVTENGSDPDTIKVTIPKNGSVKLFGRLRAVVNE